MIEHPVFSVLPDQFAGAVKINIVEPAGDRPSDPVPAVCRTARENHAEFFPVQQIVGNRQRRLIADTVKPDIRRVKSSLMAEDPHIVHADGIERSRLSGGGQNRPVVLIGCSVIRKQFRILFILDRDRVHS